MSVVFDFNDSLNDFTPSSPIMLSVDVTVKSALLTELLFLLYFVFTTQVEFRECCVGFQCFTQ